MKNLFEKFLIESGLDFSNLKINGDRGGTVDFNILLAARSNFGIPRRCLAWCEHEVRESCASCWIFIAVADGVDFQSDKQPRFGGVGLDVESGHLAGSFIDGLDDPNFVVSDHVSLDHVSWHCVCQHAVICV